MDFFFVDDEIGPEIRLIGGNSVTVTVGGSYNEEGATAEDDVDGDISDLIRINDSAVNYDVEGTYTITYNVVDNAGNPAETVNRTVNVVPAGKVVDSLTLGKKPF